MASLHKLSEVNRESRRAICAVCGTVTIRRNQGGWRCNGKRRTEPDRAHSRTYRRFKGTSCERCGFVAEDLVQLDVNHKDGNHANNDRANLETLCANCHRLITKQERHSAGIFKQWPPPLAA